MLGLTGHLLDGLVKNFTNQKTKDFRTIAVLAALGKHRHGFIVAVSGANSLSRSQKGFLGSQLRSFLSASFGIFDASKDSAFHAELKTLNYAYSHLFSPVGLVASRPFCSNCAAAITARGGATLSDRSAFFGLPQ